jgi:hypothetical protein
MNYKFMHTDCVARCVRVLGFEVGRMRAKSIHRFVNLCMKIPSEKEPKCGYFGYSKVGRLSCQEVLCVYLPFLLVFYTVLYRIIYMFRV